MSNLARIYGDLTERHLPPRPRPDLIPTAG
jgi:hypothetical protein